MYLPVPPMNSDKGAFLRNISSPNPHQARQYFPRNGFFFMIRLLSHSMRNNVQRAVLEVRKCDHRMAATRLRRCLEHPGENTRDIVESHVPNLRNWSHRTSGLDPSTSTYPTVPIVRVSEPLFRGSQSGCRTCSCSSQSFSRGLYITPGL